MISRSTPVVESVQVGYKLFQIKFSPTYEVDTRDNHDWVDGRELSAGVASSIHLKILLKKKIFRLSWDYLNANHATELGQNLKEVG